MSTERLQVIKERWRDAKKNCNLRNAEARRVELKASKSRWLYISLKLVTWSWHCGCDFLSWHVVRNHHVGCLCGGFPFACEKWNVLMMVASVCRHSKGWEFETDNIRSQACIINFNPSVWHFPADYVWMKDDSEIAGLAVKLSSRERAQMKNRLGLQDIYHRADENVRKHVFASRVEKEASHLENYFAFRWIKSRITWRWGYLRQMQQIGKVFNYDPAQFQNQSTKFLKRKLNLLNFSSPSLLNEQSVRSIKVW